MKRWSWRGRAGAGLAAAAVTVSATAIISARRHGTGEPTRVPSPVLEQRLERQALAGVRGREPEEAAREGARSPASEQVDARAYPRSYVDDRRALAGRRAFDRLPAVAPRSAFRSAVAHRRAIATAPGPWRALGPAIPHVAPEASLFFDLDTGVGTPTTQSGRVTAMAISPTCVPGDCRLWVAAAGGGIWRTDDALAGAVEWIPPPDDLPTNAFGSLALDPSDTGHRTLYAGSGEPNGSGDSEAGVGLFKSTDGGATWALVSGSRPVSIDRSVATIAVRPGDPDTIYIGTALARHGSSSVNGGRRTPPGAPPLGVYRSTDGGATWSMVFSQPPNPAPPAAGADWFQGGVRRLEIDPNDVGTLYASVSGYGLWRSRQSGDPGTWGQIFHTRKQNDFSDPAKPAGDTFGDRTEFDAVDTGNAKTRIFLGDASDDEGVAEVWRANDAGAIPDSPDGTSDNAAWERISSDVNGTPGFLARNYCVPQCHYDNVVASPPGRPDTVWLGGAMNYAELPGFGLDPPRSNGRALIRSTNGGAPAAEVTFQDMTQDAREPGAREGLHPDQQALVFAADGTIAFAGSDGGVVRVDVSSPVDVSGQCAARRFAYDPDMGAEPLRGDDLADCRRLLSAIPAKLTSVNAGLSTLQFHSLSLHPASPTGELLGGTQDNGTWAFTASASPTTPPPHSQWFESAGGDGGQSGFDARDPAIRYHLYFDATPSVNFHGNDPREWLDIYDVLQDSKEARSFYAPFIADPRVPGRAFIGMEHVWRTNRNGGDRRNLEPHCNELDPDLAHNAEHPCGDWKRMGKSLVGTSFGSDRAGQYVVATERAPGDKGTLWAGTRTGRLLVSTDADADKPRDVRFRRIDTASTPGRFVSGIAIDAGDPTHAWMSYSGYDAYTPETPGHVLEALYDKRTRRATFTDRSYDIGDQPVTDVAHDATTGDLYASTDFGVLRLPAGSASWVQAGGGLPHVAVYGLTISDGGRVLYAATHGRGAYALSLEGP